MATQRRARTILVVDDEPSIRLICRVNLELDGLRVLEASTLEAARTALEIEDVDVVLLDVHVGPERGAALLHELRDAEQAVAVAFLTGTETLDEAEVAAADAVVRKPFDVVALTSTVGRLLAYVDSGIDEHRRRPQPG